MPSQDRCSRIIGHVFLEPDGSLSVTPSPSASEEDEQRLAAIWRHSFVAINDRLWRAVLVSNFGDDGKT